MTVRRPVVVALAGLGLLALVLAGGRALGAEDQVAAVTHPRPHAAPEGGRPPGPRRARGGLADPPSPRAFGVVLLIVLAVLLGKVAWGQPAATAEPAVADPWGQVVVALAVTLTGVGGAVAYWLRSEPDRRRRADESAPPPTAAEVRTMITEAVQRVQSEGDAQHRRIRETLRDLEARLLRIEERITTNEHASMERRAEQARELGEISSDVRRLLRALE